MTGQPKDTKTDNEFHIVVPHHEKKRTVCKPTGIEIANIPFFPILPTVSCNDILTTETIGIPPVAVNKQLLSDMLDQSIRLIEKNLDVLDKGHYPMVVLRNPKTNSTLAACSATISAKEKAVRTYECQNVVENGSPSIKVSATRSGPAQPQK